jgi:DNA-directed RNA polymerase specialized sigma subunit
MNDFRSGHNMDIVKLVRILGSLTPRDMDVINRFYMQEQDAARIAADLGIAISQIQELKSRVKQEYLALQRPN